MKYRAVMLAACMALALGPLPAGGQSLPIGGLDLSGWTNMASAAARNKTDDVRAMLESGKTPDVTDDEGQSPLGYAASLGNAEMAAILLKYNAPVDRRDQFGNVPLHWASQRGSLEVMQLLLDAKATIDLPNKQGITPLMMAANRSQVAAVRLLLKRGADPQKQDYSGRDAASWAEGKANVLQVLRSAKAG